jgi:hypothetical protein
MNKDSEQRTSFWSAKPPYFVSIYILVPINKWPNAHGGHWKFGTIARRERERERERERDLFRFIF